MPNIDYTCKNFGPSWGANLQGKKTLLVSWEDLLWAAITLGKPGVGSLFGHGWHSVSDLIVRVHTVYANLKQQGGRYAKSGLFEKLDPTEKAAISYFFGMLAGKILAEKRLDVPWLFHLSSLPNGAATLAGTSKSSPDSVGLNASGKWIVLESKGRSNRFDLAAATAAKKQTRRLRKINGDFPVLRAAVQSYFSKALKFQINDPEEFDSDAPDFSLDLGLALRNYYGPICTLVNSGSVKRSLDGRDFLFHELEELNVSVGVDARILETFNSNRSMSEVQQILKQSTVVKGDNLSAFADGTSIFLGKRWKNSQMILEPEARN